MKKLILVAALMLPTVSYAEVSDKAVMCPALGSLAHSVMEARQQGLHMSELMGVAIGSEGGTAEEAAVSKAYKKMIVLAYDKPQFSSKDYRENAANEFRNKIELECYK